MVQKLFEPALKVFTTFFNLFYRDYETDLVKNSKVKIQAKN